MGNYSQKMVNFRNHRRVTLKCIKTSITLVNCKLKNSLKSGRSYNIIPKTEKQLLYEQIRNINNTLATLKKQRETQYRKLQDMLNMSNRLNMAYQHAQDFNLDRSRIFINKKKDHRHDKIKENTSISSSTYSLNIMDTIIIHPGITKF